MCVNPFTPVPFVPTIVWINAHGGFYEEIIHIRSAKLEAAQAVYSQLLDELRPSEMAADKKVAVIGGGPAEISAAYFLACAGISVTVFEKREALGGVVRYIIPSFRISSEAIKKESQGFICRVHLAQTSDSPSFFDKIPLPCHFIIMAVAFTAIAPGWTEYRPCRAADKPQLPSILDGFIHIFMIAA